jgi:hypothetical protein
MSVAKRLWVRGRARAVLFALLVACVLAFCGGSRADSGGLTAGDRNAAQAALSALNGSNVSLQLVNLTLEAQAVPAACRVHLVSRTPSAFKVYLFWIPWYGSGTYTWLNMSIRKNPSLDTFLLGMAKPVLPGGVLAPNGRSIPAYTLDTTLLSRYGPAQAKKNHAVLMAHAGSAFAKPGAKCQVLNNGDLRLIPNP